MSGGRRVGFVGLGNMGGRMTRRLVDAGHPVLGYDTDPSRAAGCGADPAGSVAEVVDGIYTGREGGPFNYREGKAIVMREVAERDQIDLAASYAYSDSESDLPMLRAVGHPVAVNPDAPLARVAREEGWDVMRFETLGKRLIDAANAAGGDTIDSTTGIMPTSKPSPSTISRRVSADGLSVRTSGALSSLASSSRCRSVNWSKAHQTSDTAVSDSSSGATSWAISATVCSPSHNDQTLAALPFRQCTSFRSTS